MRSSSVYLIILLCFSAIIVDPVAAKYGIHAIVHTTIPANAAEGSRLEISWTLADEKSGRPFSASAVFIRLIGPTGDSTESFAQYGARSDGHYSAIAKVPIGGVNAIEIGVAGTLSDPRSGHSERSDWLMPLVNDPVQK